MDFFDQLLTYTYLRSSSLSLLLDSVQQATPTITQKSGREMMAEALTGRIRSDSAMLRQGAKNATEASNIADIVASSASTIVDNLTEMLALAQEVKADSTKGAVNGVKFTALAQGITSTIANSKYNNISLLDKSGWTGDSRLTVSADGNSATVKIQTGYDNSNFKLNDMSYLNSLSSVDLSSGTLDLDALISSLSTNVTTATIIYNGNDALSDAYASESEFLVKQADILTKAAEDAMPDEEDPLLRDLGSIISLLS
ncbi:MAG: hypothetical protein EOM56_01260 [Deltaproteobacteria bacterium]|nr:hypothetical protein [Deltaproteobacteria bacterium]